MSDIFKKIRSIEAEDDAVTDAIGLPRDRGDADGSEAKSKSKPLKLSLPEEKNILDLDDLSLEDPDEIPPIDMSDDKTGKNKDSYQDDPDVAAPPKPSTRLGLTPVLPVGSNRFGDNQREESYGKASAEVRTSPKPLPNFLDNETERTPKAESLIAPLSKTEPRSTANMSNAQSSHAGRIARLSDSHDARPSGFILAAGLSAGFIWLLCVALLAWDMLARGGAWGTMPALQKLGFTLMAVFPLVLIALLTVAFRHLSKLKNASDSLRFTAESLMTPDETVITRSTIMAKSIQAQVDEVNLKVSSALTRMELLDDMVKSQGSSLAKSTIAIDTTTNEIEHRITAQREGLENIAGLFEGRMATLSKMMEDHSSQLASSGQMAEQRVHEARVSVEGAAEQIASASETVRQNAVAAAQTLSGSQLEITKLGDDVQAQSSRLDSVYRKHLNDLKIMLNDLREQQDELGATMEERLSKMRDMSLSAKVGAQSLTEASVKGRETVEALNEAASLTDTAVRARFAEMEEMVKYSTARAESISETATRQVQNSLSSTRKEIARIEADMMDLMDKLNRAEAKKPMSPAPFAGLRGAQPSQAETFSSKPESTAEIKKEANTDAPIETSLFNLRRPVADELPPRRSDNSELDIHPPSEDDIPNVLRRPMDVGENKERGRWSLKGLFGGDEPQSPSKPSIVNDEDIIKSLTALGLSPAAIVDDGCIIEAANLRKVKGASAMSQAVAKRLSEPVRHLFMAAETDADFKSDIRAFTAQFDARLAPIESDREGIRTRLESDAGRAYLLCDAALNS